MTDVLYILQRGNAEPWTTDFRDAADAGGLSFEILEDESDLERMFAGVTVVVDQGGHGTRAMIDAGAAAGVRLWQVLGTGLDHTEVAYIQSRGIPLANTPGQFSAIALAEHALFFILALAKRSHEAERNCREGVMYVPVSDELAGRVLGIVGLGASGGELARRAGALGMRIQAVDIATPPSERLEELRVEQFAGLDGLDELLRTSDYISLHMPLNDETRHIIDERRLGLLKPTAYLLNVARGRLVDEDALASALGRGAFAGAGIDVFGEEPVTPSNPLLQLDNVIVTPHTAGVTRGTSRRRSQVCVENAKRVLAGEEPRFQVAPA
jgi:phosphoglycerate dehydrogenase-like enzyme